MLPDSSDEKPNPVLTACLRLAVPVWVDRLRSRPHSFIRLRAHRLGYLIAHFGDVFERNHKRVPKAQGFNWLAQSLACLVLTSPEPFEWGGMRFEPDRGHP